MIDFAKTKVQHSVERPVLTGELIATEGSALVGGRNADNTFGVKQSTDTSGEQFQGIAFNQQLTLDYLPVIEVLVVADAAVVSAAATKTIVSGSLRVVGETTGVLAAGNPATTTAEYSVDLNTGIITVHADQAGEDLTVSYRYAPTVLEAKDIQGDILPGGAAGQTLGSVGIITAGDIYTSAYNTAVDWSGNTIVTLGASGIFDVGGTVALANVTVIHQPTADEPFLGLRLK